MPAKLAVTVENETPRLLLALNGIAFHSKPRLKTRYRHVVIAEDDMHLRKLLAARFRFVGYTVTECANGVELLHELADILDRRRPSEVDLIISDIRMPGLSGMEVLEGLRDLEHQIPMVLITAFGSDDLHTQAKRLGANAIFDKPFDVEELVAEVSKII
ncbi:response regulator [Myxococcota bacterium]